MTDTTPPPPPQAPAPAETAAESGMVSPIPKRLILAALLQVGLAGLTGFFAMLVGTTMLYAPAGPVWGLAGPAALLLLLAADQLRSRHRWALVMSTISATYGVALGLTAGALGIPLILGHVVVGAIVWSVRGAFLEGPLLPVTRRRKALAAGVAVAVAMVGVPMLLADPLNPSDTRDPAWAGVVASAADNKLTDGRRFGRPQAVLQTAVADGYLVVGGGSLEAPTWLVPFRPLESEPSCFMSRDIGRDDGPAVVIVLSRSGNDPIGLRVTKARGFHADPVADGRYVGTAPRTRDARLALAGGRSGDEGDHSWTPALAGYFCLDANAQVTRWDRGD
ncbi:MAG: hypothetical protein ABIQ58_10225 [Candidatus Limnocylindrales bacterium]